MKPLRKPLTIQPTLPRLVGREVAESCGRLTLSWVALLASIAVIVGCNQQVSSSAPTPAITTDLREDLDHDHRHTHGPGHEHEHEHEEEFAGSHAHGHTHGHRHGEPVHGGRTVSIGHTHHRDGETHYHAEVLPIEDDSIRFFLLTESDDGEPQVAEVEGAEISAYVADLDKESSNSYEVTFAQGEAGGENSQVPYTAKIPEGFSESNRLSIVVPKIRLGSERLNFSFTATRGETDDPSHGDDHDEADDHDHKHDGNYSHSEPEDTAAALEPGTDAETHSQGEEEQR